MPQQKGPAMCAAQPETTVDAAEIAQFDALGAAWWDESGPMKPLHRLNPARMGYIRDTICAQLSRPVPVKGALRGLSILDVGCGGGLVAEPLARMGAAVTGIDAGAENTRIAAAHARSSGLSIDYRHTTAEALAKTGKKYDVVTALEIVEHVADVPLFVRSCCRLLKPDGILVMSTLNRTAKSFALGIVAAEYVLRWLPAGTHDWRKFMKPSELGAAMQENGLRVADVSGLVYRPLSNGFEISKTDLSVNYFITGVRT